MSLPSPITTVVDKGEELSDPFTPAALGYLAGAAIGVATGIISRGNKSVAEDNHVMLRPLSSRQRIAIWICGACNILFTAMLFALLCQALKDRSDELEEWKICITKLIGEFEAFISQDCSRYTVPDGATGVYSTTDATSLAYLFFIPKEGGQFGAIVCISWIFFSSALINLSKIVSPELRLGNDAFVQFIPMGALFGALAVWDHDGDLQWGYFQTFNSDFEARFKAIVGIATALFLVYLILIALRIFGRNWIKNGFFRLFSLGFSLIGVVGVYYWACACISTNPVLGLAYFLTAFGNSAITVIHRVIRQEGDDEAKEALAPSSSREVSSF